MGTRSRRDEQVSATRDALLTAAERLFAEHGVHAVANRQINEAAGQANNAAVNYHFGTKTDLVRAISRRHDEALEAEHLRMLDEIGDSTDLRDWVACAVRPVTAHLEALGSPSWYARFLTQVTADPALRNVTNGEYVAASPAMYRLQAGLERCLPEMTLAVRAQRSAMTRHLVNQMAAERERSLADNSPTFSASWDELADELIDAIVGLWQAPSNGQDRKR